jgi:hypothetical protein
MRLFQQDFERVEIAIRKVYDFINVDNFLDFAARHFFFSV